MEKNQLQGLVLMLTIVGLAALGVVIINQQKEISQLSKTVMVYQSLQPTPPIVAPPSEAMLPPNLPPPNPEPAAPVPNLFDPFMNHVGDTIAGLKILSIQGVPGIDRPLAQDNVLAKFEGSATLSGTYDYDMNAFAGEEMACFTLNDAIEQRKLPMRTVSSDSTQRFCFSNLEDAKKAFGPTYGTGTATIIIDNYELAYAPAEVFNRANLTKVISKNPIKLGENTQPSPYHNYPIHYTIPQLNLSFNYPSEWGTPKISTTKNVFGQSGDVTFSSLGRRLSMGWNVLGNTTDTGREMSDLEIAQQDNPTAKCSNLKDIQAKKDCIQGMTADGHPFMIYAFKNPFTDAYERIVTILQTGNKQFPTFAATTPNVYGSSIPTSTLEAVFKSITVGK